MDPDRNKSIEFDDFRWGLKNYGLNFNSDEIRTLFGFFDKNQNGSIDFKEFIETIRVRTSD